MSDTTVESLNLLLDCFGKLTRDERNAIFGVLDSYRDEAKYYREKYESMVQVNKEAKHD